MQLSFVFYKQKVEKEILRIIGSQLEDTNSIPDIKLSRYLLDFQ